jgi:hypothetical protein
MFLLREILIFFWVRPSFKISEPYATPYGRKVNMGEGGEWRSKKILLIPDTTFRLQCLNQFITSTSPAAKNINQCYDGGELNAKDIEE